MALKLDFGESLNFFQYCSKLLPGHKLFVSKRSALKDAAGYFYFQFQFQSIVPFHCDILHRKFLNNCSICSFFSTFVETCQEFCSESCLRIE